MFTFKESRIVQYDINNNLYKQSYLLLKKALILILVKSYLYNGSTTMLFSLFTKASPNHIFEESLSQEKKTFALPLLRNRIGSRKFQKGITFFKEKL